MSKNSPFLQSEIRANAPLTIETWKPNIGTTVFVILMRGIDQRNRFETVNERTMLLLPTVQYFK